MERNRNELKVGAAVLVSIVALVVGIMWGKGFSLKVRQYDITVTFANVQGLESGSNVLANGLEKGRVHSIELKDGFVLVHASVDKDVKIFSDYRIVIESPTLLAGKVLSIYPGSSMPHANTDAPLQGSETLGMTEAVEIAKSLSQDLKETIQNLNYVLVNLNGIVGDSTNRANIAGTLSEAHNTARLSSEWLRENRADLTATLDRVEATFIKAQEVLGTTQDKLSMTADHLDSTLTQIDAVASSLHRVLTLLESNQSTAGKLLHEDELYQRINSVLAELEALAGDIRNRGVKMRHTLKLF